MSQAQFDVLLRHLGSLIAEVNALKELIREQRPQLSREVVGLGDTFKEMWDALPCQATPTHRCAL